MCQDSSAKCQHECGWEGAAPAMGETGLPLGATAVLVPSQSSSEQQSQMPDRKFNL